MRRKGYRDICRRAVGEIYSPRTVDGTAYEAQFVRRRLVDHRILR